MLRVVFSNRVELLFERLKENLFSGPPFRKRLIIVPSPAMKSWLMLGLAQDLGIAAGLKIISLESGIDELKRLFGGYKKRPSSLERALQIEAHIRSILEDESDLWAPLIKYLKFHPHSRKSERRLVALSAKLSKLFDRYEMFGRKVKIEGWQGELLRKVTSLEEEIPILQNELQVDLFSLSFLPKIHHEFLKKVAELHPVGYYVLSPCQAFWTDLLSDKESCRLKKYWEVRGGSEPQLAALEELLFDRNALLANFGRMGREMALQLEECSEVTEEYQMTSQIVAYPQYQEYLMENIETQSNERPLSLLEAIQADLLFLRNPDTAEKIVFKEDKSIQIHAVSSKMREIQVLYNTLMQIMDHHSKDTSPICPRDIIVMAPDISEYEPYIRSIFDKKVDFQIMDLHLLTQHPFVRGFMHLLSLPFSRWDVSTVLELLDFGSFRKKQGISSEEANRIKGWVKEAGIRWGSDKVHREELLKQSHCKQGMVEESAIGTWEHGMDRLLYGWIMSLTDSEEVNAAMEVIPVGTIDLTLGELLGKWFFLLKNLRKDLKQLSNGTTKTVNEWATDLKALLDNYFVCENKGEEESKNHLLGTLYAFERILENTNQYSFVTIRHHLNASLNSQRVCYREPHLQAIRFCSLLPMRALPAKVVVLLGMEEGAFPRKDPTHSLNLMTSEADYSPSQTDFDRYLFLEILLSVRQYLLIHYVTDSMEKPPSLLVTELKNYINHAFKAPEILTKHPLRAYDIKYFDGTLCSYSKENYEEARSYYQGKKEKRCPFIERFNLKEEVVDSEVTIDLKHLISFARNPVEAYYNRTLGIYLEKEEDVKLKSEESIVLSPLEKGKLRKSSIKNALKNVINLAKKEGKLPLGSFKDVAVSVLEDEINELKENLEDIGCHSSDIFDIEFSDSFSEPQGVSRLPSLQIGKVKIIGRLPSVTSKGLLGYIEDSKNDMIKVWPEYLVYLCLCEAYSLPLEKSLICAKSGKIKEPYFDDPKKRLLEYVRYYLNGMENVSPLIPEWVPDIIKLEKEAFKKKIRGQLGENGFHFYNDYMRWTMKYADDETALENFEEWKAIATQIYGEIYDHWY